MNNIRTNAAARLLNEAAAVLFPVGYKQDCRNVISMSVSWQDWQIEKQATKPVSSDAWKRYWQLICDEHNKLHSSNHPCSSVLPTYGRNLDDALVVYGDAHD